MRKIPLFLIKEFIQHKREIYVLFIIVLFPLMLIFFANMFVTVIPKDTPILIIPQSESVTQSDLDYLTGMIEIFAEPTVKDCTLNEAKNMLLKEGYYALISVPPDVRKVISGETEGAINLYFENGLLPVAKISEYVVNMIQIQLGGNEGILSVEYLGKEVSMPLYLLPGLLIIDLTVLMNLLLSNELIAEKRLLTKLKINKLLNQAVIGKLIFFDIAIIVQFAILYLASIYYELPVNIGVFVILVACLTGLYLGLLSMIATLICKSAALGNFMNILISTLTIALSSAIYPIGFMDEVFQKIAHLLPMYYSSVMLRCFMIKEVEPNIFSGEFLYISLFTLGLFFILIIVLRRSIND